MAKKVTILTDDELRTLVRDAVSQAEEYEKDSRRAIVKNLRNSRIHNPIPNDKSPSPILTLGYEKFIGKDFMFYAIDPLGLPFHVIFTFEKVLTLLPDQAELGGKVAYHTKLIENDKIRVDLANNMVRYRERGSRTFQVLELDNRCKLQWTDLINCLKR